MMSLRACKDSQGKAGGMVCAKAEMGRKGTVISQTELISSTAPYHVIYISVSMNIMHIFMGLPGSLGEQPPPRSRSIHLCMSRFVLRLYFPM